MRVHDAHTFKGPKGTSRRRSGGPRVPTNIASCDKTLLPYGVVQPYEGPDVEDGATVDLALAGRIRLPVSWTEVTSKSSIDRNRLKLGSLHPTLWTGLG